MVGIVGGLAMTAGTASADRTMVVVIDATGSMTALRTDGQTRFAVAKSQAKTRIETANSNGGLAGVQVYTFHNWLGESGLVDQSGGFVSAFTAAQLVDGLTQAIGSTPLAGSMCDAIDVASSSGSAATTTRFYEVYTDGGENDTDPMHACAGPYSVSVAPPFDLGSWQNLVYTHALDATPAVTTNATLLYYDVSSLKAGSTAAATYLTDQEFFAYLTRDTGGTLTLIADSDPEPVYADLDGDYDVDRDDAILLARNFGGEDLSAFDLDEDGTVGFSDYEIVLSRFGTGHNPPEPDPYTQAPVVTCSGGKDVVIDGKVIEDAGITIDTRNQCDVAIRNSLIVSGQSAIRVRGSGRLTIDDSIVVGEGAWLTSTGVTFLSASGSVFHGPENVTGSFKYDDRGGNTSEVGGADDGESDRSLALERGDGDLGGGCSAGGGAPRASMWIVLLAAVILRRRRDQRARQVSDRG